MIKLASFFAPLNLYTIPAYLGLVLFFDVFGSFLSPFVIKGERLRKQSRLVNWLIGLGVFIFLWFILRFFIPPVKIYLLGSVAVLSVLSFPSYIKQERYKTLISELWDKKVVFLILIPFLPALFVRSSIPPFYWDEMAYHFISPSTLESIDTWSFQGGFYGNIPKVMDYLYMIVFSITQTYSIARLINFSILLTALLYSYSFFKENFGFLVGFLFVFIFFSLPQEIISTATSGYVDISAISFYLIGLVSLMDYVVNKKRQTLLFTAVFWGLALGTKYTPLTGIVPMAGAFAATAVFRNEDYKKLLNFKFLGSLLALLIIFGGYWYIKNYVLYGNPIYPFLFGCKEAYASRCMAGSGFFSGWTLPVSFGNLYSILQELIPRNLILQLSFVAIPILQIFNKNKKTRVVTILLIAGLVGELIVLSVFSGFLLRYHQHLQFLLIGGLVVQLANKYEIKKLYLMQRVMVGVVGLSVVISFIYSAAYTNTLRSLSWQQVNYSLGKTDIYEWIELRFPKMKDAILWCENPPDGKRVSLARFDPDLIWFEYAGLMRAFMTNCYYENPSLAGVSAEEFTDIAVDKELDFWIASANKCEDYMEESGRELMDPNKVRLRVLNREIVCNSEEVLPYLYHFDYRKLQGQ